jgi:hypothetical protein
MQPQSVQDNRPDPLQMYRMPLPVSFERNGIRQTGVALADQFLNRSVPNAEGVMREYLGSVVQTPDGFQLFADKSTFQPVE